jgi:hypothetical protein
MQNSDANFEKAPLQDQLSFRDQTGPGYDGSQAFEAARQDLSFDHEILEENSPPADSQPSLQPEYGEENLDKYMGMFTGAKVFKKKNQQLKINAGRLLLVSLGYLLAEYSLYFMLQLLSYFVFPNFWVNTTYVLGTVFFLLFLILASFLVRIQNRMDRLFPFILKILEFVVYIFLVSWGVAYLDFAFLSLSYMVMFDLLALIVVVG